MNPHPPWPVVRNWMAGFFIAMFTLYIPVAIVADSGKTKTDTNHPYTTNGVQSHAQP